MRNGLLLAVGVLTLALLPAIGNASAPMFTDVPGVICLNTDGGTTYAATNVFTYDSAVLDPDSDESTLVWTFVEDATGLTVDPLPGGGVFETVEGVGAVASKSAARTASLAAAVNNGATDFSLVVSDGTTGQAASAVALGAGSAHAAVAADDLYTTIIVAVHDAENNVAYQTVIVKADYAVTGGANQGGLYENVLGTGQIGSYTFANQWSAFNTIASDGGNVGGVMTIVANGANWDFGSGLGSWGFAYYISPEFTVVPGYVYRARATVGTNATDNIGFDGIRMRLQEASFKLNGETEISNTYTGDDGKLPTSSTTKDYEVLFEPPQDSRFDGLALNVPYKLYLDYMPLFSWADGVNAQFSNVVVDRFAIPTNEQGLLYYADTIEEWETMREADGTTVSAPIVFATPTNLTRGFKLAPNGNKLFNVVHNAFQTEADPHDDYSAASGGGATGVDDNITTVKLGAAATAGDISVFSCTAPIGDYMGTRTEIVVGEDAAQNSSTNAWIPASIVETLLDTVYYRTAVSVKAGPSDTALNMPQLYMRQGTPFANYNTNMSYNEWSGCGASPTEWTTYTTWTRGYDDATPISGNEFYNSWTFKIQVLDTSADGWVTAIGGTTCFDSISCELYPVARFAD